MCKGKNKSCDKEKNGKDGKIIIKKQEKVFDRITKAFKDGCKKIKVRHPEVTFGKIHKRFVSNLKKSNVGFLTLVVHNKKIKIDSFLNLHIDDKAIPDFIFTGIAVFVESKKIQEDKGVPTKIKDFDMDGFFKVIDRLLFELSPKRYEFKK